MTEYRVPPPQGYPPQGYPPQGYPPPGYPPPPAVGPPAGPPPPRHRPIHTRWWFWLIVGILVIGIINYQADDDEDPTASPSNVASSVQPPAQAATADEDGADGGQATAPLDAEDPATADVQAGPEAGAAPPEAEPVTTISVPDVKGLDGDAARQALATVGLDVDTESNDGSVVIMDSNWTVISQSPKAGEATSAGTEIKLVVAKVKVDKGYQLTEPDVLDWQHVKGRFQNVSKAKLDYVQIDFGVYDDEGVKVASCFTNESNVDAGVKVKFDALCTGDPGTKVKVEEIDYW